MLKFVLVAVLATIAIAQEPLPESEALLSDLYIAEPERSEADEIVRVRRDFFGGRFGMPGGGSNTQVGYRGSIYNVPRLDRINPSRHDVSAWGQLSQSSNRLGMTSPITYSAGADWLNNGARGLSASASHIPGLGSQATLGGYSTLFNNDNNRLTAALQHTKSFDPNFREIGHGSTTGSLSYDHSSGASVAVSGTRTPGMPNSGTVSTSIPVATFAGGKGKISVGTQSTFADGHKPNHAIGAEVKIPL